jgi:hypothetical protein
MRAAIFLLLALSVTASAQPSCNEVCKARAAEAKFFRPGLAERQGDRLILKTAARTLRFLDNSKACDNGVTDHCAIYDLVANAPGSLAVRKFGFEGSDSTLIDTRSGKQTVLTGVPVFSPDGKTFLVTEFSNEGANNLEIWRRHGDSAVLEWAHPFKLAYAEDPALKQMYEVRVQVWTGNRIALALSDMGMTRHWTGSLTRDAAGWHLSAKSPPGLLR